jgi:hypothetical protein
MGCVKVIRGGQNRIGKAIVSLMAVLTVMGAALVFSAQPSRAQAACAAEVPFTEAYRAAGLFAGGDATDAIGALAFSPQTPDAILRQNVQRLCVACEAGTCHGVALGRVFHIEPLPLRTAARLGPSIPNDEAATSPLHGPPRLFS